MKRPILLTSLKKHSLCLLLILTAGFLGLRAYFHPGLYTAHDIWHQVARLYHYSEALRDGQLLPGWIMNMANGFGYPLFYFSYHFPWMLGGPLVLLGLSIPTTIKLLFGLSFLLSGFVMYGLVQRMSSSRWAALVAGILYMWLPYHFLTLYVSASIGTAFQFVALPLLLWGGYETLRIDKRLGISLIALGTAMGILSHLMTFILYAPFVALFILGIWFFQKQPRWQQLVWPLLGGLLGMGMTSYYLLPLLAYYPLVKAGSGEVGFENLYGRYFITLKQIIYSRWGVAPITSDAREGEISFQLGIAQWLGLVGGAFAVFMNRRKSKILTPLLSLTAASMLLMLYVSKPMWDVIAKYTTIDFPFRLLLVTTTFATLATGYALGSLPKRSLRLVIGMFLIVVAFYTNRNHIRVNQYTDIPVIEYVQAEGTTNTYDEYLPLKADRLLLLEKETPLIMKGEAVVTESAMTTSRIDLQVTTTNDQELVLRQFDFPGLQTYLDGNLVAHRSGPQGLVAVEVPDGTHELRIETSSTNLVKVSKFLSALSALGLISLLSNQAFFDRLAKKLRLETL